MLEHQPGYEDAAVLLKAATKIYYGHARDSRALLQELLDTAERHNKKDTLLSPSQGKSIVSA
jgi:hypothetical protein